MKRFLLSVVIAATSLGLFAQTVDKAKELLKANKIPEAKTEIDKVLADSKNQKNAEAWYYKCKIYGAVANNEQLKAQTPDATVQAFDALKKYVQYDDKKLILLQLDQYKPINEIYQGYFQAGAAAYNSAKYADALANFKGALEALTYMSEKGWVAQKLDTTSILYAGISAEKANNRDEAAGYYKVIADSGITKIGGNDMVEIYKWLADYYSKKKDYPNEFKYLSLGKKVYPTDSYWPDTELELIRAKGGKDSLFSKYEEITTNFPTNHLFFYNYGLELYQYASDTTTGKRPANYDELIKKAQEKLNKSLQLKPDYSKAALVLGQISYNAGVELQIQAKAIHGAKPEDVKKRTELRAQATKKFDEAIPYFEKVDQILGSQGNLKMEDRTALKDAYDLLITIYEQKNVKDKAASYTTKFNNVDKDHHP
jgi:tetratricopeptide (TPR) repeat protein